LFAFEIIFIFFFFSKTLENHDTIIKVYELQLKLYQSGTDSVEDSIVSVSQYHVLPIARGKDNGTKEFRAKLNLSLVNSNSFIDNLKWDAYNEGVLSKDSIGMNYRMHRYSSKEVMADRIYRNQEN